MHQTWTIKTLAEELNCSFSGSGEETISKVCSVEKPQANGIAFAENTKTLGLLEETATTAIIAPPESSSKKPLIFTPKPRVVMAKVMQILYPKPITPPGVHPKAIVSTTANIHPSASIGAYTIIEDDCTIGAEVTIKPHTIIQAQATVQAKTTIQSHCFIGPKTIIGENCFIEPTCKIGPESILEQDVYLGTGTILKEHVQLKKGCRIDNQSIFLRKAQILQHAIVISRCLIRQNALMHPYSLIAVESTLDKDIQLGSAVQIGGRSWVQEDILERGDYSGTYQVLPIQKELRRRASRKLIPKQVAKIRASLEKANTQ